MTSISPHNMRRSSHQAWLLAAALVGGWCSAASAQNTPWHLGHLGTAAVTQSAALTAVNPVGTVRAAAADPKVAPAAINIAGLSAGPHPVVVAVIDSGVMAEHPSLAGRLLPGYDMQSQPANLRKGRSDNFAPDPLGTQCDQRPTSSAYRTHGTEVASLVAGNGHGGVFGVNPQARVLPIRVMGACGMARRDLMDAIRWAAGLPVEGVPDNAYPARVINLSLSGGSTQCSTALQALVDQLGAQGVVLVAAAGNNFHKALFEPANCQGVISVGSVDAENRIEVYSALDARTVLYAPGGGRTLHTRQAWGVNKLRVATFDLDFLGRERANALDRGVGTSYAAPLVAGFISFWLSHRPQTSTAEVLAELPQFLRDVEPLAKCPTCQPKSLVANARLVHP